MSVLRRLNNLRERDYSWKGNIGEMGHINKGAGFHGKKLNRLNLSRCNKYVIRQ